MSKKKEGTWHTRNRESAQEYMRTYQREVRRFARHGITKKQYEDMLESQGGGCALCGSTQGLVIDHDHATSLVRGVHLEED